MGPFGAAALNQIVFSVLWLAVWLYKSAAIKLFLRHSDIRPIWWNGILSCLRRGSLCWLRRRSYRQHDSCGSWWWFPSTSAAPFHETWTIDANFASKRRKRGEVNEKTRRRVDLLQEEGDVDQKDDVLKQGQRYTQRKMTSLIVITKSGVVFTLVLTRDTTLPSPLLPPN